MQQRGFGRLFTFFVFYFSLSVIVYIIVVVFNAVVIIVVIVLELIHCFTCVIIHMYIYFLSLWVGACSVCCLISHSSNNAYLPLLFLTL